MATRPELEHTPSATLQQSKRRLDKSRAKIQSVQGGGSDRPSPSPQRSAGGGKGGGGGGGGGGQAEGAAKSLSGTERDFELVAGRETDALGLLKGKVKKEVKAQRNVEEKKKGRTDSRKADLEIPVARAQRLSTPDGRTSFHFSHDSVSKTSRTTVSEAGKVNRPGAAKAHNKYIERESAVAVEAGVAEAIKELENEDAGMASEGPAATNDNDGQSPIARKEEDNERDAVDDANPGVIHRPHGRSLLRSYRAALGALLSDTEQAPGGPASGPADRLRDVPGRDLVSDNPETQMLLRADEVPVVGRPGRADQGVRRPGDEDHGDRGGGGWWGRLKPVPARLPRGAATDAGKDVGNDAANDVGKPVRQTAAEQGSYIERQEAMAIQPDGTRVLFTNIDPDASKREEFWRLVEDHEFDASPDKMTFTVAANPKFWNSVAKHSDCPRNLAEAIETAVPGKPVTVNVDDNVEMRRFLSTQEGWNHAGEKRRGEDQQAYKQRKLDDTAKFQDGRGGRVQFRIIGELPHELSVAERASILKSFSEEFEKKKIPFVSVMHAPDHTNNDKNWHFHLVYYDRPCRRLTADDVVNVPKDPNPKNEVVETAGVQHVGAWDFTVVEKYKTSSREIRNRRPFQQEKDRDLNSGKWIEGLRSKLANITNDHLEKAGVNRRLDARRHEEMGIHSDPQEHLGTRLSNMEAMGIATPKGVSNEERQWKAILTRMDADLSRRKNGVDRQGERWLKEIDRATMSVETKKEVRGYVTRWHQHRTESEEHQSIAENLEQHMERMLSRANKVRETCEKNLAAIAGGKATKFQGTRYDQLFAKNRDAMDWLEKAAVVLKDEHQLVGESRETANRERMIADTIETTIERALLATRGRVEIAPLGKDRAANDDAQKVAETAEATRAASEQSVKAVTKAQMDRWIGEIMDKRRRLVKVDRKTQPMAMTEEDRAIVSAPNYATMSARLSGVMKAQDKIIAEIVEAIAKRPRLVVPQTINGQTTYVLTTARRDMAEAFEAFREDPAIVDARTAALDIRSAQAVAAEDRRRATTPEPARDPAPVPSTGPDRVAPVEPSEPRRVVPDAAGRQPENVEAPTPGTPRPDDVGARAPTSAPQTSRVAPESDGAEQRRRSEELAEQRAEIGRRRAISERIVRGANEGRRVIVDRGVATFAPRHLEAMAATPEDVADAALQKRLVGIAKIQDREIARLTGYASNDPKRVRDISGVPSITQSGPPDLVEFSRKWRDDETVQAALAGIRDAYEQNRRAPPVERERAPTPTTEPTATRTVAPRAEEVTPPAPRQTAQEPVQRDPKPVRPRHPTLSPERAPAPENPARVVAPAPVDEPVVAPRMSELRPDYDMRAEAKAYAEEQERRRRQGRSEAAAPRTGRAPNAPEGSEMLDRVARVAAQRAGTQGAHPLIDQWIAAVETNVAVEERREIALRITTERAAREKLRDIDRNMARRIREDSDQAKADRQPGLGLGLDQGVTPKR